MTVVVLEEKSVLRCGAPYSRQSDGPDLKPKGFSAAWLS